MFVLVETTDVKEASALVVQVNNPVISVDGNDTGGKFIQNRLVLAAFILQLIVSVLDRVEQIVESAAKAIKGRLFEEHHPLVRRIVNN